VPLGRTPNPDRDIIFGINKWDMAFFKWIFTSSLGRSSLIRRVVVLTVVVVAAVPPPGGRGVGTLAPGEAVVVFGRGMLAPGG
jgi:hypothetical protein